MTNNNDASEREPALHPGDRVGRYEIGAVLGFGGMGEVYEAHDPQLDRTIALKVIRPDHAGSTRARGRLLREAQAMASVVHPNVLPVFEAGHQGAQVFIAMERVWGQTLKRWLKDERTTREILDVFTEAGQGLAAAHNKGIMHRDFKPANVLVGDDGRVRVLDFGLASAVGAITPSSAEVSDPEAYASGDGLTETGLVLGTPSYMAPEQHMGEPADARCDQYAFCVALFEALYGVRPYRAESMKALLVTKLDGIPASVPGRRGVTGRMHRALLRGLRPEPADRWPTMDALLHELRPRSHRLAAGLAGLAGLAVVGFVLAPGALFDDRDDCREVAARDIGEVWGHETRERARLAFEATGRPYAAQAWSAVEAAFGDWHHAWVNERSAACRATRAGKDTQARLTCLARARRAFEAAVGLLVTADAETVQRSSALTQSLRPPSRCMEPEHDGADPGLDDPTLAAAAEEVRAELDQVEAQAQVGRLDDALAGVERVVLRLEAEPRLPLLLADALVSRGLRRDAVGRYDAIADDYERAYWLATEHRDDRRAVIAASQLVFLWAIRKGEADRAAEWARHAEAAYGRLGDSPDVERRMLIPLAAMAMIQGDPDTALRHDRRRLELAQAQYGPDALATTAALHAYGHRLTAQGRYDEAREPLTRAYEIRQRELGPRHPDIATSLYGLAMLDHLTGELPRARERYREALSIREDELGPEHPDLGGLHNNLGSVCGALGHDQEARQHYERALAIHEAAKGPEHPHCALPHNNLGQLLTAAGEYDAALEHHRRALAISEAAYGPEHLDLAYAVGGMADVHLARGELEAALPLLERVLALRIASDRNPANLGGARFAVAKVLVEMGRDPARARTLAREAREAYAGLGEIHREQIDQVDQWLAEHG